MDKNLQANIVWYYYRYDGQKTLKSLLESLKELVKSLLIHKNDTLQSLH